MPAPFAKMGLDVTKGVAGPIGTAINAAISASLGNLAMVLLGLEQLKPAVQPVTPGDKTQYQTEQRKKAVDEAIKADSLGQGRPDQSDQCQQPAGGSPQARQ